MSRMSEVAEGLKILEKYWPNGDIAAEHDVIYAGGDPGTTIMSLEDKARMEILHWFISSEFDCWTVFV